MHLLKTAISPLIYIKNFCTNDNSIPPVMNYQSSTITSDLDKPMPSNKFFHSVFNSTSTDVSLNCLTFPNKSLCSISISETETFQHSHLLIHQWRRHFLQLFFSVVQLLSRNHLFMITTYLHKVYFNRIFQKNGDYHYITPTPKSKDTSSITQYRPIYLSLSLEKLV